MTGARQAAGGRLSFAAQTGPFLLALGVALSLAALSARIAPLGPVSTFEVGNDFVALLGFSFAAIQLVARRRTPALRAAWALAVAGTLAIALEDHLEILVAPHALKWLELSLSSALWAAAAVMIAACGRRYAMRRHVSAVMGAGVAVALSALVLNLALQLTGLDGTAHRLARLEDLAELIATSLLAFGLALTQLAPMKEYRFTPETMGRTARALLHDFGIGTRPRYPTSYRALALPLMRELFMIAIILRFWPVSAAAVRREHGRSAGAQLLDLLKLGLLHNVDAKSYYVHEFYRRQPGLFDATLTRVETKNGLTKRIQDLRAGHGGPRDMNDKLEFFRVCEEHGVPSAAIFATVEDGAMVWLAPRAAFDRDLFVKDRSGRGGRFTLNFERAGPALYRADDGALVNLEEALAVIRAASAGRRLLIQPKLRNHDMIRTLADRSLVVFRVMTCLDRNGEPQLTHGVLRLLRRFEPDWPASQDADWGCEIDVLTGELGLMTGDAPETCTRWFANHPITGERVSGRRLEGWRDIAETALAAHRVFRARVLVGWDIGWTPDGPVILEGNSNPDVSYFQRVSRTPVGLTPLGPLLCHHLGEVRRRLP